MNLGAAVAWAVVGIPVGSFLNVVVERVPDRTPLRVGASDREVPAVAWLGLPAQPWLLRGGRRGRTLPTRWLAVELVTATVFAVLAARYGDTTAVLPLVVLGACLVAVTFVDLEHLRIPDRITAPTLAVLVPAVVLVSIDLEVTEAIRAAFLGSLAYFLLLLLPHLVYPRGMGFGDVKLALVMGWCLGWVGWTATEPTAAPLRLILYALVAGCLLGVVFGLVHAAITRRRGEFPFGPALALACLIVIVWAPELRA